MDENQAYFDNLSGSGTGEAPRPVNYGGVQGPGRPPRGERGTGKGLFLIGLITGISGALLVLAICYL